MTGYEACLIYTALKVHFSVKDYDAFAYNFKTNLSYSTYLGRPDKTIFKKLSRKYPSRDLIRFFASHLYLDHTMWVGEMTEERYREWQGRMDRLYTVVDEEMVAIQKFVRERGHIKHLFRDARLSNPPILSMARRKEISMETFIVLDNYVGFFKYLDKNMLIPFVWEEYRHKCDKYRPFIVYDDARMKNVMKEHFKHIDTFQKAS
jgi:hypothetical protein